MTQTTVLLVFSREGGGTEGVLARLDVVPRLAEEVTVLDSAGETTYRQRVTNVRHIVSEGFGALQVEVVCGGDDPS